MEEFEILLLLYFIMGVFFIAFYIKYDLLKNRVEILEMELNINRKNFNSAEKVIMALLKQLDLEVYKQEREIIIRKRKNMPI